MGYEAGDSREGRKSAFPVSRPLGGCGVDRDRGLWEGRAVGVKALHGEP